MRRLITLRDFIDDLLVAAPVDGVTHFCWGQHHFAVRSVHVLRSTYVIHHGRGDKSYPSGRVLVSVLNGRYRHCFRTQMVMYGPWQYHDDIQLSFDDGVASVDIIGLLP